MIDTRSRVDVSLHLLFGAEKEFDRFTKEVGDLGLSSSYGRYFFSSATIYSTRIKLREAPDAYSVLYEDGSGTYNGFVGTSLIFYDPVIDYSQLPNASRIRLKKLYKQVFNKLTGDKFQMNVRELALFRPDERVQKLYPSLEIMKIDLPSEPQVRMLLDVFGTQGFEPYENADAVFLMMPANDYPDLEKLKAGLAAECASELSWLVDVRFHPRDTVRTLPSTVVELPSEPQWELLWLTGTMSEDVVLVGFGSSAMASPKRITNLEPTLIYLCNLLPEGSTFKRACQKEAEIAKSRGCGGNPGPPLGHAISPRSLLYCVGLL